MFGASTELTVLAQRCAESSRLASWTDKISTNLLLRAELTMTVVPAHPTETPARVVHPQTTATLAVMSTRMNSAAAVVVLATDLYVRPEAGRVAALLLTSPSTLWTTIHTSVHKRLHIRLQAVLSVPHLNQQVFMNPRLGSQRLRTLLCRR